MNEEEQEEGNQDVDEKRVRKWLLPYLGAMVVLGLIYGRVDDLGIFSPIRLTPIVAIGPLKIMWASKFDFLLLFFLSEDIALRISFFGVLIPFCISIWFMSWYATQEMKKHLIAIVLSILSVAVLALLFSVHIDFGGSAQISIHFVGWILIFLIQLLLSHILMGESISLTYSLIYWESFLGLLLGDIMSSFKFSTTFTHIFGGGTFGDILWAVPAFLPILVWFVISPVIQCIKEN
ncbi:MAG: hypothetical protein RTU30_16000, partial [Candidatus Thorarchaeota archaeon]